MAPTSFDRPDDAVPRLGVIIPVYNEEKMISSCIKALKNSFELMGHERKPKIIVSDGGSSDASVRCAREAGAMVVETKSGDARGRGPCLQRGVASITKENGGAVIDTLLFLHVDCVVPSTFFLDLEAYWVEHRPQIGFCKMKFTSEGIGLRLFEYLATFESIFTTFGDQGLVVSRKLYEKIGGFPNQVLLEDVAFLRRARRTCRIHPLPMTLSVSARKFDERGVITYMIQCCVILTLYVVCGASPQSLAKLYSDAYFLRRPCTLFIGLLLGAVSVAAVLMSF